MLKETSLEKKLAIAGHEDIVTGFKALGFNVYPVKEAEDFKKALEEIVQQNSAVCLVQDDIYRAAEAEINNYKHLAFPIFIPFAKDFKMNSLDTIVKDLRLRATGTF
ncbi:MAG: V-type ATP synthase subunit F [Candidatus Omnitrophica bacterium]|nr:V-type ATP synthase subunit F [Candidatus Omnitrophota bacterium]MDD5351651.1 V-type ATP synthase subunit F [Candidatus Omnitrophota bacterium]MDD5550861.1 V-type ATP synthase subunit F [Candidatus Omnitrophota bacterium]